MNFVSIGTSWIAEAFIESAALVSGLKYFGSYSRSKQKAEDFAKKFGASFSTDSLEEIANNDSINAVYIGSPNSLHYSQSKTLLRSNKHIICEKPIAANPNELKELIEFSRKNNLVYIEAIMFLHTKAHKAFNMAIGKIGKITSAHLAFSQLSSKYPALLKGELPNIFNPELKTGCLMDIGIYNIYTAISIFGYPKRILSSASFLNSGADANGTAIFDYGDKQITLTYSKTAQHYAPSEIYGDKGTIQIDSLSLFNGIRIIYANGETEEIYGNESRKNIMSVEAERFYNYVKQPEKYREEYYKAQNLSLDVSKAMKEIREQNKGFKF